MAKSNRLKVVLAKHGLSNKWLPDKSGEDLATIFK